MGTPPLWSYLFRKGGRGQWDAPAKKAEKKDRIAQNTKDPAKDVRPDSESRKRWIEEWIEKRRKPEEEWTTTFDTQKEVVDWILADLAVNKSGKPFKLAIDLGQLYVRIEKIKKDLKKQVARPNGITVDEAIKRFVAERERALNDLIDSRSKDLPDNTIIAAGFDHSDVRELLKYQTEWNRMEQAVKVEEERRSMFESMKRYQANVDYRNEKAYDRPSKVSQRPKKSEVESEQSSPMEGVEQSGGGGPTEDVASPVGGTEAVAASGGEGTGVNEGGEGQGKLPKSNDDEPVDIPFPPWEPINQEYIDNLSSPSLREQAQTLRSKIYQLFATTEAEFFLSDFLAGTLLPTDPRIATFLSPTSDESTDSASPHRASPAETVNIVDSQDSDLIPSSDPNVVDYLISTYISNGAVVYRVVAVARMWQALGWTNRWEVAALCAFVTNDFTNGGIPGAGFDKLDGNVAKFKTLREFARDAKEWCEAVKYFKSTSDSFPQSKVGSVVFKSLRQMEEKYETIIAPFYQNKKETLARLPHETLVDSLRIQVGGEVTGNIMRKWDVRQQVVKEVRAEMEERKQRSLGKRKVLDTEDDEDDKMPSLETTSSATESASSPNTSQNRNHLMSFRVDSRPSSALPFVKPSKPSYGSHYRTANGPDGRELLPRLQEENRRIKERLGIESGSTSTSTQSTGDDDPGGHLTGEGSTLFKMDSSDVSAKLSDVEEEEEDKEEDPTEVHESKRRRLDKGKEKAVDVERDDSDGEVEDDESGTVEEKEIRKWAKRFPFGFKNATKVVPASASTFRNYDKLKGVTNGNVSWWQFLGWIRQVTSAEMPLKVELLVYTFATYFRFYPDRLVKLVVGGTTFTKWSTSIIQRRGEYEQIRQRAKTDAEDQPFLVPVDAQDYKWLVQQLRPKVKLEGEKLAQLERFVEAHDLDKLDMAWIKTMLDANKATDVFCFLTVIQHHRLGLPCPTIIEAEFDNRNFVNYATSIHNSTRSDALSFDYLVTNLMTKNPLNFLDHDESTTRFGVTAVVIRRTHSRLLPDGDFVLSLLSRSTSINGVLRESISSAHIGSIPYTGDPLNEQISSLRSKLLPLLVHLAMTTTTPSQREPLTAKGAATAADAVLNFLIAIFEWLVRDWRFWVEHFKLDIKTIEDWIVKAGGTKRTVTKGGRKNRREKQKAKKWSSKQNGDEEEEVQSNLALRQLQAFTACFSVLRQRSFRYSPQTMIVNSVSAYNLSGTEYGLETRLQTTMISNNVSARRENLREDFREFTPFVLPIPRSRPTSRHSDPRRIARQSLIRYSETDWTLKRQLAQPEKVFLRNQDEWIGLKLRRDPSTGAFVVRPEPEKDLPAMEKVVGEVRAFFHGIGITNTAAARHGAIFIMDALFKPHFGHVIANGEIGVSPTHYHIGVNDPRYFSRHVLAKMDPATRQGSCEDLVTKLMTKHSKLSAVFKKMEPKLKKLKQVRHRITKRSKEETSEKLAHRRQLVSIFRTSGKREKEDWHRVLNEWKANPQGLEQPKRKRVPRFHSKNAEIQQTRFTDQFVPRFSFVNGRFVYNRAPTTTSSSQPIPRPLERKPLHLYMAGVPEGANELDRPAQAEKAVSEFFEKFESPADPTNVTPSVGIFDDGGEHVTVARTVLDFTGEKSTRHYHHQSRYKVQQGENSRVAKVLEKLEPNRRLFEAQEIHNKKQRALVGPALVPPPSESKNFLVQQRVYAPPLAPPPPPPLQPPLAPANLALPPITLPPLDLLPPIPPPVLPQVFPSQLVRLAPRLQHGMNVKQGQLGQLRSVNVQEHNHRTMQKEASAEVQAIFPNPKNKEPEKEEPPQADPPPPVQASPSSAPVTGVSSSSSLVSTRVPAPEAPSSDSPPSDSPPADTAMADAITSPMAQRTSVLYGPSAGDFPQSGSRKGSSVVGQLAQTFTTGLHSTPWLDVTVCTCGEGYTSSVCPDPNCRASLINPRRNVSTKFSSLNRIKACLPSKSVDHRDGLAGPNIAAVMYQVSHGIHQNPLSLNLAQTMENGNRYTPHQVNSIGKEIAVNLSTTDSLEEQRTVMERLYQSTTEPDANIATLRAALRGGPVDDESDVESDVSEEAEQKQRRRKRRGRKGKGRVAKSFDYADPVNDD